MAKNGVFVMSSVVLAKIEKATGVPVSVDGVKYIFTTINPAKCKVYSLEARAVGSKRARKAARKENGSVEGAESRKYKAAVKEYEAAMATGEWASEAEWKKVWRAARELGYNG